MLCMETVLATSQGGCMPAPLELTLYLALTILDINTQEEEAGGLEVQGHLPLHREFWASLYYLNSLNNKSKICLVQSF